jgi:glycerophosphoryl diester phosphodiesterase
MPFSLFTPLDRLLAPAPAPERVRFLSAQAYAHRGLHGGGIVENSRAAFQGALDKGLGIELDVQAARGGEPYVFHDERLERLTDSVGHIRVRDGYELEAIMLRGTSESIPRLAEILNLVDSRVPVLVEVKTGTSSVGSLCLGVRRILEGYRGPVAVMSFNPEVGFWFELNAPKIIRGLVVSQEGESGIWGRIKGSFIRHFSLWRAKPDFLAYDIRDLPASFPKAQRKRGLKILTWTVRTADQEKRGLAHADEIIFERPQSAL